MIHRAIDQVMERVEDARSESDFNQFFSLLLAGEALFKTVTLGIIAAAQTTKTAIDTAWNTPWREQMALAIGGAFSKMQLPVLHPSISWQTHTQNWWS